MSGSFNHFRHSVFARNDDKIKEFSRLLGRKGKEAYFYYFTLIEHCSAESDEGQTEFKIHNETLRNLWETNARGVQTMCKLLTSCALLMCKQCANHVICDIPNLPYYLGSYDTKKRKGKESKGKENNNIKPSPLSFLFCDKPEIQSWLNSGIHETHLLLLNKFSHHELADLVEQAYAWALPKGVRAESWLYTFVSNKKTHGFGANQAQASFKRKGLGVMPTQENPTGNPYKAQRLAKEKEGNA